MKDKIIEIFEQIVAHTAGAERGECAYLTIDEIHDYADRLIALMQPDGEEVVNERGVIEVCVSEIAGLGKYKLAEQLQQVYDNLIHELYLKSLQPEITEWLENKIKGCDELGDMEKEKWAFQQVLKKLTPKTK